MASFLEKRPQSDGMEAKKEQQVIQRLIRPGAASVELHGGNQTAEESKSSALDHRYWPRREGRSQVWDESSSGSRLQL